jgi:trimeric autotransporter adhesin
MKRLVFLRFLKTLAAGLFLLFLQFMSSCSNTPSKPTTPQNPTPVISSFSPENMTAGGSSFVLQIQGSSFIPSSKVQWNGQNRTTTYISDTQLNASITAADIATNGVASVTVSNPSPGGGSTAANFTVGNPSPAIVALSPESVMVGESGFNLQVIGSGFLSNSIVRWKGQNRTTTYISRTQLSASITAADIAVNGVATVTVFNSSPGGGTSSVAVFPITNPAPSISGLSPQSAAAGGSGFALRVTGNRFVSNSTVRWNGSNRTTTYVSDTQLDASISAADIQAARVVSAAVYNPAPGGGTSNATGFSVKGIVSLSPASAIAGASAFTLRVTGVGFASNSTVRWNSSARTTTYVSDTQLDASISAADIAAIGQVPVTVYTPGGSASNSVTFAVGSPTPTIVSLDPSSAAAGGPEVMVRVLGGIFMETAEVRWNGSSRPTSFINSGELRFTVPAGDLAAAGRSNVTVVNPLPEGVSSSISFHIYLSLKAGDLIYDPFTRLIYASVRGAAGAIGNTITEIDPEAGTIGQSFYIGSDPGKLAISDNGKYLYAALDGAAAVRRFDISARTAGLQFSLGSDSFFGPYYVEDIEVQPGNASVVAVSRKNLGVSPRHAGVAIYEEGVQRSAVTARHTGSNVIEFSTSPSTLFGYNNETTEFGFRRMLVDVSGVAITNVASNLLSGFYHDIEFDNGRIYSTSGRVIDPEALTLLGTYALSSTTNVQVRPDSSAGRTFFLVPGSTSGTVALQAFDQNTFGNLGSEGITNLSGTAQSFIRWGTDGLAFRTDDQVFLFRSSMVASPAPAQAAPILYSLNQSVKKGGSNLVLSVFGAGFVPGATILWNGSQRTTYFVSERELLVAIPAGDIRREGNAEIRVRNPGSRRSAPVLLRIN